MSNKVKGFYLLALFGRFSLFALLCYTVINAHGDDELPRSIQLLIVPGPLLLFLTGMLNGKPKTHLFAAIAALVYFSFGVIAAFAPETRNHGMLQILCSSLLFFGGVMYARHGARQLNELAQSSN